MSKIITWATPIYSESHTPHETDSLFFASDVVRYMKFNSPYSIKFCLNETLRYSVNNQNLIVPKNSFLVVDNGLEMECLPCEPGVSAFTVYFTSELIQDVLRNRQLDEKKLLDTPDSKVEPFHFFQHIYKSPNALSRQMLYLAQQMAAAEASESNLSPDVFYSLAGSLFSLQQDAFRQIGQVNARMYATREELFRRVLQAREFMQDHWAAELSLNEIARQVCLSPYHFHRSFREAFGCSPMKWFRRLKLEKARDLLVTQKKTVTEIALNCGFSDVFSFSKAFKREWGVNPSEV